MLKIFHMCDYSVKWDLTILFGAELFSKATMVVEFFQLFLMQELFFCTKCVCRIVTWEITHPPPPSRKWNGPLLTSQLSHECMFTCKVYVKRMTYLVRWQTKINISLVLIKGKCMKHSFYHRFIYEQIWIILKR